jgi:hypothetical protein
VEEMREEIREVILYSSTGFTIRVEGETEDEIKERLFEALQELRSSMDF